MVWRDKFPPVNRIDKEQRAAILEAAHALARHVWVYLPERRGHGHTADVEGPLTLATPNADFV